MTKKTSKSNKTKDAEVTEERLEFHEYCLFFPPPDELTFAGLVEDIRENGLIEPIVTYEGKILDGRSRYLACLEAGVEPRFIEYTGDDPSGYTKSKNAKRSDLSR